MPTETDNVIHMLEELIRSLVNKGAWDEAMQVSERVVKQAVQVHELENDEGSGLALTNAHQVFGNVLRERGELKEALRQYNLALELVGGGDDYKDQQARLHLSAGVCFDLMEDADGTIKHYQRAIDFYEKLTPPGVIEIADLSNNLAYVLKAEGRVDDAESLYLKALQICHEHLGKEDERTANLCNNLGALYQQKDLPARAREMHMMALDGRSVSLGEDHPDTAQSHGNLAAALVGLGENDLATEHFQKAIAIYEKHNGEFEEDLELVKENYAIFTGSGA